MDLESAWNVLSYHVFEKRIMPWSRQARRWAHRSWSPVAAWRQAHRDRTRTRRKERRVTTDVEKAALYRAMLPQVDEDFLRLLKEELRETLLASRKNWRNYAKLGPSAAKAGKFTVSELAAN